MESREDTRRDRAQLLLIAAVILGLTVLSVVVILNANVYAHSTSGGYATEDIEDMETYEAVVQDDLERLIQHWDPDQQNLTHEEVEGVLDGYTARMGELSVNRKPVHLDIEVNETESDSQVGLIDQNTDSFGDQGNTPFTLIENVENISDFTLSIEPQSANEFIVRFTDDSGTVWMLEVEGPTDATVRVGTDSCTVDSPAEIDVLDGTVNGSECFEPPEVDDGDFDIVFENTQQVVDSSFSLTADGDVNEDIFNEGPDAGEPYYVEYVTNAIVDIHYTSEELSATTAVAIDVQEVLDW